MGAALHLENNVWSHKLLCKVLDGPRNHFSYRASTRDETARLRTRVHSSLGYLTLAEFAPQWKQASTQEATLKTCHEK